MSNTPTAVQIAEMSQAGLRFVERFEMQRVLVDFEKELLALDREKRRSTDESDTAFPAR